MVATYTSKKERRYRYYVCRAARQDRSQACPTKSVPAHVIEDSVVAQLRTALANDDAREQLHLSEMDLQKFRDADSTVIISALVKRIGYDGASGAVSLKLQRMDHAN
jgi:hypothetical protein